MNILLLRGIPRHQGYTTHITSLLLTGLRDGGAVIDDVDLMKMKITPCMGCYHCWLRTPGKCRFRDDMDGLLEKVQWADTILCATPLYHYSMNSAFKLFFERTMPLTQQGFETTPGGLMRNRTRYPDRWQDKKLGFIAAGAFHDTANFEGLKTTFRLLAEGLNLGLAATLMRPEAYLMQFKLAKPRTVKTVETALVQAGLELAASGAVSAGTSDKVCLPLAPDQEHFIKYSEIYWEHALALQTDDLAAIQRSVVTDMRILMSEMARSFDPLAASRLRAVIQFDFPDKNQHYRFSVRDGKCSVSLESGESCDLRVTVDSLVWAQVFMREINVRDALTQRKIALEGDKSLFTRLDRYFPPPVA